MPVALLEVKISETVPRVTQGKNREIFSVLLTKVYLDIYLSELRKLIEQYGTHL